MSQVVGNGGSDGSAAPPAEAAGLPDAPFEALGRLARTGIQFDHAGTGERRARERFLLRVFRPRFLVGRLVAGSLIAAAGVASLVLVLSLPGGRREPGRDHAAVGQRPADRNAPATALPAVKPPVTAPLLWGGSVVRFAGGTELRLLPDGRGRIAESSADRARVVLEEGSLYAHVVHRPATLWLVEAGPFLVRVTGTKFKVGWEPGRGDFEIAMVEGSVTVEGPKFSQHLAAGQTLLANSSTGIVRLGPNDPADTRLRDLARPGTAARVLGAHDNHARASEAAGAATSDATSEGSSASPSAARPAAPAPARPSSRGRAAGRLAASEFAGLRGESSWSRRLSMGGFRDVLAEAKLMGIDTVLARRGLDDLAALATAARLSGENDIARRALSAQRSRFPGTAAAAEAAFLLGRLAEDVDRNTAAAAAWYDRCLEEAPVGDLAAEALGRQLGVMVTLPGSRPRTVVRQAARRYLDRFPDGPHAARARALLESPDAK